MEIIIEKYTKERIDDVIQFELDLRKEENFWGWKINDEYIQSVKIVLKMKNLIIQSHY